MMKRLFIPLLFLIFLSCEETIDIDYPEEPTNLVLNANLVPGDTIKASLSLSVPFEEIRNPPYLKNGKLEVFENNQFIGEMEFCEAYARAFQSEDSVYIFCLNTICKSETSYTIRATHPDFDPVQGTTSTPKAPIVSDFSFLLETRQISFTLKEHSPNNTFYVIEIIQQDSVFSPPIMYQVEVTTRDLTLELIGSFSDVIRLPSGETFGVKGYISSPSFDQNGEKRIVIQASSSILVDIPAFLRVISSSESFYQFSRTKSLAIATSLDNPFSEPYEIFSNISNGYGILASYQDTLIKLE